MNNQPLKILVVEDNPGDVRLLKTYLTTATQIKFEVTHVERLSAALALLAKTGFDAILLDLGLPDAQGSAAFTPVQVAAAHTPILILTGLEDDSVARELVQSGAQDYLVKGRVDDYHLPRAISFAIERKKNLHELQASQEYLQAVLDSAGDAYFVDDADTGQIIDVNRRMCEMYGYTYAEALRTPIGDLSQGEPPYSQTETLAWFRKAREIGPQTFEWLAKHKDGHLFWAEVSIRFALIGGEERFVVVVRDINERKQIEAALIESEARFKAQYKGLPVPTTSWKRSGNEFILVDSNDAAERIMFGKISQFYGKTARELYADRPDVLADFDDCFARRTTLEREMRLPLPTTGQIGHFIVHYAFVQPDLVLVHTLDITERKQAEEALRESEERVRAKLEAILLPEGDLGRLELADVVDVPTIQSMMDNFFSLTKVGIGIIDLKGRVLVATGWQDICTKFHRAHPKTCQYCIESDTLLSEGIEPGSTKIYRCKNNMWDIATPITVGDRHLGNLFLGQFLFTDEQPDYEIFKAQARQHGFDEREYLAALERVPRWDRETVDAVMNFYMNLAGMLSKLSYGNLQLARSLADRERLTDSLRESQAKLQAVMDYSPALISIKDLEGNVILGNRSLAVLDAPPLNELIGKNVFEIFPREVAEQLWSNDLAALRAKAPVRSEEVVKHKDGTWHTYLTVKFPIYLQSDQPFGICAISNDITERKQAEQTLRETSERLSHMLANSPTVIYALKVENGQAKPTWLSDNAESVLGFSAEDGLKPEWWPKQIYPEDQPDALAALERLFDDFYQHEYRFLRKDGQVIWLHDEHRLLRDADNQPWEIIGAWTDITARKQAEEALKEYNSRLEAAVEARTHELHEAQEKLIRQEKLAVLGQMAGSVGHELRNPLGVINNAIYYLRMVQPDANAKIKQYLGIIDQEAHNADKIISDLLDFSRIKSVDVEPVVVADLVRGMLERFPAPENVRVTLDLPKDLPLVYVDPRQITQVLGNLVLNACQAMSKGGELRVSSEQRTESREQGVENREQRVENREQGVENREQRVENREQRVESREQRVENREQRVESRDQAVKTDPLISSHLISNNPSSALRTGWLLISVKDTGCGITPENMKKLFEPLFTTKPKGIGLGLVVSKKLVEANGGRIEVESEVGVGSTFTVWLPVSKEMK